MKRIASVLLAAALIAAAVFPVAVYAASNEQVVFEYLTNTMGLNTAAACGAMANLEKESNFNPHAEYQEKDGSISMVFVSGMACAVQRWRITVLCMDMIPRR